jgi:hypothetical protein
MRNEHERPPEKTPVAYARAESNLADRLTQILKTATERLRTTA